MLLHASRNIVYADIYSGAHSILFLGTLYDHSLNDFERKIGRCAAVELGAKWKKDPLLESPVFLGEDNLLSVSPTTITPSPSN